MGVALKDGPVHEGTRVALVGVADYVFLVTLCLSAELPFQSRGETAAASSPESGCLDLGEHLFRFHGGQGLGESCVTVPGNVLFDVVRIDVAAVSQRDTMLFAVEGDVPVAGDLDLPVGGGVKKTLDQAPLVEVFLYDLRDIVHGHPAVERTLRVDDHYGAHLAHPVTPRLDQGYFLVQASFPYLLPESVKNRGGSAGVTAGPFADQYVGTIESHSLQAP